MDLVLLKNYSQLFYILNMWWNIFKILFYKENIVYKIYRTGGPTEKPTSISFDTFELFGF